VAHRSGKITAVTAAPVEAAAAEVRKPERGSNSQAETRTPAFESQSQQFEPLQVVQPQHIQFESQTPKQFETQTQNVGVAQTQQFETQTQKFEPKVEELEKPPQVFPNTYWNRKGGGWVCEYKRKTKGEWLYEYYGLLKLETWEDMKRRYQDAEKLKSALRGAISFTRAKLKSDGGVRSGAHRLRLVGKRR
jgi:hypothetical protein